jgi:hypothetical protein
MPRRSQDQGGPQFDLFDLPDPIQVAETGLIAAPVAPADMSDDRLLASFPRATLADVEAFGDEIRRRRAKGWQAPALALWERFRGFGATRPLREQLVVLTLAASMGDRRFLQDLLARGPVNACLEPNLLLAAAACGLALPSPIVSGGLTHGNPHVRRAAAQLAMRSNVAVELLVHCLRDPARPVRREAAIALADAGETIATASLLMEMRIQPSRAGLQALGFVANEDAVIGLGQIARLHPDWCLTVIEVLETLDHPKAARVVAGLMA